MRTKRLLFIAVYAAILAGCAEAPVQRMPAPVTPAPVARAPVVNAAPVTQHYSRGGGYYLDDGPGDNPPANIGSIPNAQPKWEPLRAACNRPYRAMGKTYHPETRLEPYTATGIASWYGRRFNGLKTSSGEIYDMYAMTAAHPTLPIPSYARVENLSNGKSVIVRINDRGPFRSDRLIDLSYTAAYQLGFVKGGSAKVRVESILPDAAAQDTQLATTASSSAPVTADGESSGIYLQLAAFSERDNAEHFLQRLRPEFHEYAPEIVGEGGMYRVHVGPFATREDAEQTAAKIAQTLAVKPVVMHQ